MWKVITKDVFFFLLVLCVSSCDSLCTSCPIESVDSVGITGTDQSIINLFLWSAPILLLCILSLIGIKRIEEKNADCKTKKENITKKVRRALYSILILLMILPGLNVLLFFLRFILYPFILGVGHILGWTAITLFCCIPLFVLFAPIIAVVRSDMKVWKRLLFVLIWGGVGCMGAYYLWSYIGDWIIEHLSNISFSDIYPMLHALVVGGVCYIVYKLFLE